MNFYNLVSTIRNYCAVNGIMFVYGKEELREVHLQHRIVSDALEANELVLFAGFNEQPTITSGRTVEVDYVGFLMLGQKCEDNTSADLDETQEEKYDRRLQFLKSRLATIIGELSCENDLEVTNTLNFDELLNQFDENIDCVQTPVTFSH